MSTTTDIGLFKNYVGKHFFIRCKQDSRFVIDSRFLQNTGGGPTILFTQNFPNNANQVWTVDAEGHIMNVQNPRMILHAQSAANSTPVDLIDIKSNPQADTNLAKWRMNSKGEIVSMENGIFMLNVQGGKMKNRAGIIMYRRQGPEYKNDKWELDCIPSQVVKPRDIGLFKEFVGKPFYIKCQQNPAFVLDTAGKQRKGGGQIHLWTFKDKHDNQIWTVDSEGHIMNYQNPNSVLCAGNTNDHFKVEMIDKEGNPRAETDLARWSLNTNGEIVSMANANVMLNVQGATMKNWTAIIMYHKQGEGHTNDKWTIQLEVGYATEELKKALELIEILKVERDMARKERDEALAKMASGTPGSDASLKERYPPGQQNVVTFEKSSEGLRDQSEMRSIVTYNYIFVNGM